MISENKTRVQVTLGNELLGKLDEFCRRTGMTRSSYISYIVATSLDQYDKMSRAAAEGVQQLAVKSAD